MILPELRSLFLALFGTRNQARSKEILCAKTTNGGLRAPDPDILFKSLRLAWISRLLIPKETTTESWKSFPSYFFKKVGGQNFLL